MDNVGVEPKAQTQLYLQLARIDSARTQPKAQTQPKARRKLHAQDDVAQGLQPRQKLWIFGAFPG